MAVEVGCIHCGAGKSKIRYEERTYNFHTIDSIQDDGTVELDSMVESFVDDDYGFKFFCTECEETFSFSELIKADQERKMQKIGDMWEDLDDETREDWED